MKIEDAILKERSHPADAGRNAIVMKVVDAEFQTTVLSKLACLEAKIDMLVGDGQPGRMKMAEDRLSTLEKNDIRRSVYDRLVNAAITVAISAAIALHDHLGLK